MRRVDEPRSHVPITAICDDYQEFYRRWTFGVVRVAWPQYSTISEQAHCHISKGTLRWNGTRHEETSEAAQHVADLNAIDRTSRVGKQEPRK